MHELRGRAYLSEEARAQETVIKHGYQSLSYVTWSIIAACTAINALFLFVVAAGPKVRRMTAIPSPAPLTTQTSAAGHLYREVLRSRLAFATVS